jgi:hypothetical protein
MKALPFLPRVRSAAIVLLCHVAVLTSCQNINGRKNTASGTGAAMETIRYRDCTMIANSTTMLENNNDTSGKGGCTDPVQPKSNVPQHDSVPQASPKEEKTIGIGMPGSQEEMDRLKEKAKKHDNQ